MPEHCNHGRGGGVSGGGDHFENTPARLAFSTVFGGVGGRKELQKLKKAKRSEKKTSAGCQKARILFREAEKKTRQVEKENSWESNKILLERERENNSHQ